MAFSLYQFLKRRYTIHVFPPLNGNLVTSNNVPGFDVGFQNVRLQKEELLITRGIQSFISKELRKEMLSVKETLRNEIKLELSNIHESITTDLLNRLKNNESNKC